MCVTNVRWVVGAVVATGVCVLTLTGCSVAPAAAASVDYSQSLNRYYEGRPLCLWRDTVKFPVENATPDQIRERGFNALVDSGLLVPRGGSKGSPRGSQSFDLSREGRSAFERDVFNEGAGDFCYGRRKVISLEAARQNSRSTELIDYHYSLVQPAAWASEDAIQSAFPEIANELSGPHKAQATLLDTTDGWEVSGTPAVIPPGPNTNTSTLAKAKALFVPRSKQGF